LAIAQAFRFEDCRKITCYLSFSTRLAQVVEFNFVGIKTNIMSDNSVSLHRVLKASPEKVYRAFTDGNAMAAWLPPYGYLCVVHSLEAKKGGTYKMRFINFTTGNGHSFGGNYLEVRPNEFLKYTDKFDDPNVPGEMLTSVWFKKVSCGTELKITQEGIPAMIPAEMCYLGWQESLDKLINLVEPDIQDPPMS